MATPNTVIPPHTLFRAAEIAEDWFVFSGRHRVQVPVRVMERGEAGKASA